tara:strand:- start:167 stop:505 length:339 start_codon:yes stop_codon:yes gene_type:complete
MTDTIFSKIIKKEIPADLVHEDEKCIAFNDISPQAPTHILVIPRKEIAKLSDSQERDKELLGHLMFSATLIAKKLNLDDYRLVINNGADAGQTVFHLHIHILAGRPFGWPPG